jgi:hypothetical protein
MCSTGDAQLARICRAIEELAARPASGDGAGMAPEPGGDATQGGGRDGSPAADIGRLAAIWAMVADADPELAKRLPGYLTAAETAAARGARNHDRG